MKNFIKSLKAVKTITIYAILMFYRDKTAIFFSLFVPITIMSIFGILNFNQGAEINLGIVKPSDTQLNKTIIETFSKIDAVELDFGSYDDEINALKNGDREMVMVLPKEEINPQAQDQAKIEIFYDETKDPATRGTGLAVVNDVIGAINDRITNAPKLFNIEQKSVESRGLTAIDYIIPGIIAMSLMQMNLFGVIGGIVSWRDKGILKRLLATPVHPSIILFSQVMTRLSISLMQSSLLLAMGIFAFGLHLSGSLWLVLLLALLGGVIFLNIGFTLSGVSNTQNTVIAVANLVMMPQMFLSGVFFMRSALPELVFKITEFLPLTYLADGLRSVMIEGATLSMILGQLYGLLAWVVISFLLAVKFFRWE